MKQIFTLFLFLLFLISCNSITKNNAQLRKEISPELLKKDVEFSKNQLLTKHVDIDWYHPKSEIIKTMDSLKNNLKSPMKPNDFSRELQNTISKFGHRHNSVTVLKIKPTKIQKKHIRKTQGPMSQLVLQSLGDRILLKKIVKKDSVENINTELLAINDIPYKDFSLKYKGFRNGDGYNKTMDKYFLDRSYVTYVSNEIGFVDSINLTLKKQDSVFTRTVTRIFPKEKNQTAKNIAKKNDKTETLNKSEKVRKRLIAKQKRKIKSYFGYSQETLEYQREILFPVKEDSSVAVLKIKNFTSGAGKKGYNYIFDSINKLKIKNLILDIRNNGGGKINHINQLYAHLTTNTQSKNVFADSAKVSSKTAVANLLFNKFNPVLHTIFLPVTLGAYTKLLLLTRKKSDGNYYFKFSPIFNKKITVKNKYTGNLYVLANGGSYSASSIISSSLRNDGKAIFVGEETGGDYNGTVAGQFKCDKLKYSNVNLCYGIMKITPNTSQDLKGRGIFPDKAVELNFDDLLQNKDPQLNWILQNLKKIEIIQAL